MPPRRRRKRRHKLNPLRFLPNEAWAQIVTWLARGLGAAGVVAAPTVVSQRANEVKLAYANEATNTALATGAALQESLTVFRRQFAEFTKEIRESRLRERRAAARLPENMIGPAIPYAWEVKAIKKPWWKRWGG